MYKVGDLLGIKIVEEDSITHVTIKIEEIGYDLHRKPLNYRVSIVESNNITKYAIDSETCFDLFDLSGEPVFTKFTYYPFKEVHTIKKERSGTICVDRILHKFRSIPREEILNNRAKAYNFLKFGDDRN
jgi:hypothetical protein